MALALPGLAIQILALKAATASSFVEMYARESCQNELNISNVPFMQSDQKSMMHTMRTNGKMN